MRVYQRYAHAHHNFKMDAPVIRQADDIDHYELILGARVGLALEPLIERLRRHTLSRRDHARLISLLVENSLERGQLDETKAAMKVIDRHWKRCWRRYLPMWPFYALRPPPIYLRLKRPGVTHILADINPDAR